MIIQKQEKFLNYRKFLEPYNELRIKANNFYNTGNYVQAIFFLNQYIEKVPFDANVYQLRAISYYRIRDYEKSIEDVNLILDKGTKDPALLNLRGVNFRGLNNMEEACKDFLASMKAGDKNGETNYMNYCANKN